MGDVMYLARAGGLVTAAGPPAVVVPQDDRATDRGRDVPGDPDVQRQARAAQPGPQLLAAQEARQPARTRQEIDRLADHRLLKGFPGAGGVRRGPVAEPVELDAQPDQVIQGRKVHVTGDHGGD